jgi:hypothetical protein
MDKGTVSRDLYVFLGVSIHFLVIQRRNTNAPEAHPSTIAASTSAFHSLVGSPNPYEDIYFMQHVAPSHTGIVIHLNKMTLRKNQIRLNIVICPMN